MPKAVYVSPPVQQYPELPEPLGSKPVGQSFWDGRSTFIELLDHTQQIFSQARNLAEIQTAILRFIMDITQAEAAILFDVQIHTEEMVVSACCGAAEIENLRGLRVPMSQNMITSSLEKGDIRIAGDLYSEPLWLRAASPLNRGSMHNLIILPVRDSERLLSIIHVYNYLQADMEFLQLLTERFGYELRCWNQLQQAQHSNQRLEILIDAIGNIGSTLDRQELLRLVTEQAARLLQSERSSLFLVEPSSQQTLYQLNYQTPQPADPIDPLPVRTNKPGVMGDKFSFLTRSALSVPITVNSLGQEQITEGQNVLGGLMVLNKQLGNFEQEDAKLLGLLADQASVFLQMVEMYESTQELYLDAIKALAAAIDAKDPGTQGHSKRVSDYSVMIAQEIGLSETRVHDIRISSLLHDIGKIGVPDVILNKLGKLSDQEIAIIRRHPVAGANILNQVNLMKSIIPGILEHHERLDGSGYPFGLRGEQISLYGRIIMVADVFDAMTSNRPYRPALRVQEVMDYIVSSSGILFDRQCVEALVRILSRTNPIQK
jgi:putative nucleotidyltransferase with HDIG domain